MSLIQLSDDYGSDVHDELRVVREDLREYNKNKDVNADAKEKLNGFLGEAGVDEVYEDIDSARTILRDKLGGDDDEPYYDSSIVDSFATESEGEVVSDDDEVEGGTNMRARRKSNRVMYYPDCEKVTSQVGQVFENVKEYKKKNDKKRVKQGMTSNRLVSTPRVINSALVTGDIGYKLSKCLKWKRKEIVTQRQLQYQSAMHKVQTRSEAIGIQTRPKSGKAPKKK
ncbi:hypothetical protein K7X08_033876 [Anisodus acutangulus]|uniref:Uncharacterized protein n=1 Tax=Anisodus acutangulus TaxID=402998 RepID=A0A9Q1RCF8_9SOLA|nr:hypothetical protein K7X08_033876 [Anisodus acutangulus]